MAIHPEVQQRAQKELDSFFKDSPSTRSDAVSFSYVPMEAFEQLQYLRAVLKEVLRFAPVANIGTILSLRKNPRVVLTQ